MARLASPERRSHRPRPAGRISAISCKPGCKNSLIRTKLPISGTNFFMHPIESDFGESSGRPRESRLHSTSRAQGNVPPRAVGAIAVAVLPVEIADRFKPPQIIGRIAFILKIGAARRFRLAELVAGTREIALRLSRQASAESWSNFLLCNVRRGFERHSPLPHPVK